jgi:hypothetical protein
MRNTTSGGNTKYSRGTLNRPLVYVTEMVAFFRTIGRQKEAYAFRVGSNGAIEFEETQEVL